MTTLKAARPAVGPAAFAATDLPVYEGGGSSVPAFEGILDQLATPAAGAWSVARRLTADYEGDLIRLRRASDNAESDFGFDGDGVLDTAAVATWIGGSSGRVVTIYDQIGAQNLTQGTAANQPGYTASLQGGRAGAVCLDNGDKMTCTLSPAPSGAQAHAMLAVGRLGDLGANALRGLIFVGDGSSSSMIGSATTGGTTWWWGGAFAAGNTNRGGTPDTNFHTWAKRYDGTTATLAIDGSAITPISAGGTSCNLDNGTFGFNTYDQTNGNGVPELLEAIYFATDITSGDVTTADTDQATFYGL